MYFSPLVMWFPTAMRHTNVFVDPEDSQLVADAKNVFTEPVPYTYTEVPLGPCQVLILYIF